MMNFIVASTIVGLATAASHTATPYAPANGVTISDDNEAGQAGSFNALNLEASLHEPYLIIGSNRSVTIGVRGSNGKGLHPQAFGNHYIEFVFVSDQDGYVVCKHQFTADDTEPTHTCADVLADGVTSVTSYEYCNLHGLWVGPELNVAWEVAAAAFEERTTQSDTIAPDYYFSTPVPGDPVLHQPAVVASGNGYSIAVLGTGGEGLHPHNYDTHYIEGVFARDQHDAVVVYQELADNVETAQSLVFTVPETSTSLLPFEFCNLHGLWVGEPVSTVDDMGDEKTSGAITTAASIAAVAAATAASCL